MDYVELERLLFNIEDTANAALQGMFQTAKILAAKNIIDEDDVRAIIAHTFAGVTHGSDRGLRDHIRNVQEEMVAIVRGHQDPDKPGQDGT